MALTTSTGEILVPVSGCSVKAPSGLSITLLLTLLEKYEFSSRVRILDAAGSVAFSDMDCRELVQRNLTHLTNLFLSNCQITSVGLSCLIGSALPIRSLDIQKNHIGSLESSEIPIAIARKTSLTDLSIGGASIGAAGLRIVAQNTNLRSLSLDLERPLTQDVILALAANPSLRSLSLTCCGLTTAQLKSLCSSPSIRSLQLGLNPIMGEGAAVLRHSATITSLALPSSLLTDQGLKDIAAMRNLTSLDISRNTNISSDGMNYLRAAVLLEELFCDSNTKIGDEGVRSIASLPHLTCLSLRDVTFSEEVAEALVASRSLRSVLIGSCSWPSEVVTVLASSKSIVSLSIPQNPKYSNSDYSCAAEVFKKNTLLASLSIREYLSTPSFLVWCSQTNLVSLALTEGSFIPNIGSHEMVLNEVCEYFRPGNPVIDELTLRNRRTHSQKRKDFLRLLQILAVSPMMSLSQSANKEGWWTVPRDVRERILLYAFEDDKKARLFMGKHWLQIRAVVRCVSSNASEIRALLAKKRGMVLLEKKRWHRGVPVIELM